MAKNFPTGQFPALDKEIEKLLADFRSSEQWPRLSRDAQNEAEYIIFFFAEQAQMLYRHFPKNWNDQGVEEILTQSFVKKLFDRGVITRDSFFVSVKPVLGAFFDFLAGQNYIDQTRHQELKAILPTASTAMRFTIAQKRKKDPAFYDDAYDDTYDEAFDSFDRENRFSDDEDEDEEDEFLSFLKAELERLAEEAAKNDYSPVLGAQRFLGKKNLRKGAFIYPSTQHWDTLYTLMESFRKASPWGFLDSGDLILIELPGREEPVFCTITGKDREELRGVAL